jgi:4-hydroxybenzoate polyprenyltransferase
MSITIKKLRGYAVAAHFGPTMIVTAISFLLARQLWWEGPALVIAFTVFLGQLIIGWSNDLYDYQDDLKHHRAKKPLVVGTISFNELKKLTLVGIPIVIIVNLLGPLGLRGGSVYLLGVGCGIAYNFYFKFSWLSPLPYAIACAALPASIFYAVDQIPPLWVLAVGSLFGVAFHFLNVLKDLSADVESKIDGLPQRAGKRVSIALIALLLSAVALILLTNPVTVDLSSNLP